MNEDKLIEDSLIAYLQGTLSGVNGYIEWSFIFFSEDEPNLDVSDIWLPYKGRKRPILVSEITDSELRTLFQNFAQKYELFVEVVANWSKFLISYLNVQEPIRPEEWIALRKSIDKHRQEKGASWMQEPLCQEFASSMKELIAEIQLLTPKIEQKMAEVYAGRLVIRGDIGDQRAKDLIDESHEKYDRDAITLLKKALTYGESGIQASKAYICLGMRYEDIGEIELAIEAYSKALTAWQPSAMIYFERGKLYYQMHKLREAKQDFEQALAYTREDGLREQEQEEAKRFLSSLTEN